MSRKLDKNNKDKDKEDIIRSIARSCITVLVQQTNKKLIDGVSHNKSNEVIKDTLGYQAWINDFRAAGKKQKYA